MRASGKLLFPARINELQPIVHKIQKCETHEVFSFMPITFLSGRRFGIDGSGDKRQPVLRSR